MTPLKVLRWYPRVSSCSHNFLMGCQFFFLAVVYSHVSSLVAKSLMFFCKRIHALSCLECQSPSHCRSTSFLCSKTNCSLSIYLESRSWCEFCDYSRYVTPPRPDKQKQKSLKRKEKRKENNGSTFFAYFGMKRAYKKHTDEEKFKKRIWSFLLIWNAGKIIFIGDIKKR